MNLWREMEKQEDLPNWERIFILGEKQRLTRPSIAPQKRIKRSKMYLQYLPSEDLEEEGRIYQEVISGRHGLCCSDCLWGNEEHKEEKFTNLPSFYNLIPYNIFLYILRKKLLINDRTVQQIIKRINEFQTKIKFIIMSPPKNKKERERELEEDGKVKNFFGRTEKLKDGKIRFYPKNKDEVVLQLWKLSVLNKGKTFEYKDCSFWYALFITEKICDSLPEIITTGEELAKAKSLDKAI